MSGAAGSYSGSTATDIVFVYVTHPDIQSAEAIGHALVETGVAACVNLLPGMRAIYRWEGRIETGQEAVMIIKTRADLLDRVRQSIRAAHPYDCPCIAAFPVADGDPAYLDWIGQSCAR